MHRWCSGSIAAFQAVDMGSIPVRCNFSYHFLDLNIRLANLGANRIDSQTLSNLFSTFLR